MHDFRVFRVRLGRHTRLQRTRQRQTAWPVYLQTAGVRAAPPPSALLVAADAAAAATESPGIGGSSTSGRVPRWA